MPSLPQMHEPDAVAAAFGVTRRWLLDNAAAHPDRFPSVKIGGRVRFTTAQVEAILASHTRTAPARTPAEQAALDWGRPPRTGRRFG